MVDKAVTIARIEKVSRIAEIVWTIGAHIDPSLRTNPEAIRIAREAEEERRSIIARLQEPTND